ncbi:MAG: TonB-dependent receptor plug domain-containing protein [Opitutaceae bacterium]
MKAIQLKLSQSLALLTLLPIHGIQAQTSEQSLPTLFIDGQQTANVTPVSTYETPISNLEFEPRIDLQSRNMGEAQGDVSIRGGIFENTGFRIGAATLIDPQTGHYFAEIPIAPEMLNGPEILTGADNALYGFNSTVGTISYGWSQIQDAGSITVGGGDHDLNFQRIHSGFTGQFDDSENWTWGAEAEYSRSESNGTVEFGDHDFDRVTGRIQLLGPNSQTDLFAGYQSKSFGWPELYAAPFGSNETENLKTRLFLINHQHSYAERSFWEATAYHRRHSDHYIYDRFNPDPAKPYLHETEVSSLGLSGLHAINDAMALNYAAQFTADEIESNSLTFGDFNSRSYAKLSLLPEYRIQLNEKETLTFRAGASFDDTNRDTSEVSAIGDISWEQTHANGDTDRIYLVYSEASQVVGYTALNSNPAGYLFGGDSTLERETSQNLELGGQLKRQSWSVEGAIFYRWDDDVVDWVYGANINNRAASAVDISTFGVELIATKRWDTIEAIASYTFLDKDEDYGDDTIEGSFYALNYANHRATLGAIWTPSEMIKVRIDNEWRNQEDNPARTSDDEAFFTHVSVSVYPPQVEGLELFVAVDNAWDDDFQDVPGTPGRGDQYSAGVTYRW